MFQKILVPVDVNAGDNAHKVLTRAQALTAEWGAEMHVVTVVPDMGMGMVGAQFTPAHEADARSAAEAELAALLAKTGLSAQMHVLSGRVYDRVIALAASLGVDLIIIGAHKPEFSDYLLGSNAARVVRHATMSVMVLRG